MTPFFIWINIKNHINTIIMGLNSIKTSIQKRGQSYVDKLLNDEVVITEKLDTFRILFEKIDGEVKFFKKNNSEITLIERTLNDVWEQALLELPTLIGETDLPEGIRYGVAYTPVERPLRIPYSNLPRYILTDMTKRVNGKVIESYDYNEVKQWAGILCMGRPPVLFEGKLNEEQKRLFIAYDTKNYNGEFDTFSEMITKTLQTSYSKEAVIEGVVIKSGKHLIQVISYEFDILDEAYKRQSESRDFYDIVLLSLNEFMDSYKFPKLLSETTEELYIEIINDVFVKYCATEKITEGLEPSYLTSPKYGHMGKLNPKFINNKETLKYINEDPIYEALYRVFLSSFRKYKKPYGLLSETVVDKFNTYVGVINEMISDEVDTAEYVNDYVALNENRSKNITVKALKRRQPNDIDNMRVIASVQNAFLPPEINVPQGENRVAVYLTTLEPFTQAQMTNIEQIHNQWNVPVVLAAVGSERDLKGKNFHISDVLVRAQMKSLSNFNKSLIPSYMILDRWSLKEIFEFCRPHFEPLIIFTDKGKNSELSLQLFYEEEVMGGKINTLDEFNIGEMENKDALAAARAVEDGNGSYFMELTPKPVHNFYDQVINEYRTWEGAEIAQFDPIIFPEIERQNNNQP